MNAQLTSGELEKKVITIISDLAAVKPDEIKTSDRLREDLSLDSVSSMELLSALAEELDLDIEMEEAMEVTTVEAVIQMAKTRLGVG